MSKRIERKYLLRFQNNPSIDYSIEEAEQFIKGNPQRFDEKRTYELLTGIILATSATSLLGEEFSIGFILKSKSEVRNFKSKPTIEQLFNYDALEDTDIDLFINSKHYWSPFQITRMEPRGHGSSPRERLRNLITKKFQVQPDKYIQLAILCDEDFTLESEKLHKYVSMKPIVPFRKVHLLCQLGRTPRFGEFQCLEIYPELLISEKINVRLG